MITERSDAAVDTETIHELFGRGFVVLRGVFAGDDLAEIRADYESIKRAAGRTGGELNSELRFDDPRAQRVRVRLERIVQSIASARGQQALLPFTVGNYIEASEVTYGLHCDYGILSPSDHAFKVWIPLVKQDPARDGMTFVPADAFRAREPALAAKIAGRGAAAIKDTDEIVIIGKTVERSQLATSVRDLCETPEVSVGDMIVFRAHDTFHRSQEPDPARHGEPSSRVAWALPIRMAGEVIRRRELFGGKAKRTFLGRRNIASVVACSLLHRRDSITYDELAAFEAQVHAGRKRALALYYGAYAIEPLLWRV